MIARREFLAWAAAQVRRGTAVPEALVVWTNLRDIPDALRRECIVFPRAYAAAGRPELARRALETGKFPLGIRAGDFALPFKQLTARSPDDTLRMTLGSPPGTITVVTALGDGKDSPSESSLHVPLAIRYPGMLVARGAPEILISHVDVMPTLFGLADLTIPAPVQGRNLAPLLTKRQGEVPDAVYAQGTDWRVLIRGYEKAVLTPAGEIAALYNLADDPEERTDLAPDPQSRLAKDGLRALAQVWMRRLNDGFDPSGARLR